MYNYSAYKKAERSLDILVNYAIGCIGITAINGSFCNEDVNAMYQNVVDVFTDNYGGYVHILKDNVLLQAMNKARGV